MQQKKQAINERLAPHQHRAYIMLFTHPHDPTDLCGCTTDNLHAYRNRRITLIKPYVINTRINTVLPLILPYLLLNNTADFFKAQFKFKYTPASPLT